MRGHQGSPKGSGKVAHAAFRAFFCSHEGTQRDQKLTRVDKSFWKFDGNIKDTGVVHLTKRVKRTGLSRRCFMVVVGERSSHSCKAVLATRLPASLCVT